MGGHSKVWYWYLPKALGKYIGQCRGARIGLMCSLLHTPIKSQTAAICTDWRHVRENWLTPKCITVIQLGCDEGAGVVVHGSASPLPAT